MKKYTKLLLICMYCVFLSACGSDNDFEEDLVVADFSEKEEGTKEEESKEKVVENEEIIVEDTVEFEEVTVEEAEAVVSETIEEIESIEPVEVVPSYTYSDLNQIMYAKQAVNVRNLPGTNGEKVGGLSFSQEVTVTGQCNESKWYRIVYNGNDAYVSNKYLVSEKPEVVVAPAPVPTTSETNGTVNSGGSNISGSGNAASVTVPTQQEITPNSVWVPTNGGKKYHTHSGCSNMDNPIQVTEDTAIANGFTPCKRCH